MPIRSVARSTPLQSPLAERPLVSARRSAPARAPWLGLLAACVLLVALPASAVAVVPANDNFANALVLGGPPASVLGSNVQATTETGEPIHAGVVPAGPSVWWTWTAASTARVLIDVCATNFDNVLAVYTGTAVGALTPVASDDDDCGLGARVGFAASAGTVYKVAVAGFNGSAGSFTLAVSAAPVAVDDARTVGEDSGATNLQVLANDTDAEGDPIEITDVGDPPHGTATIVQGALGAPDQLAYTPDADYCNEPGVAPTDDFSYTVVGGDTATVAVTVTCVEDAPVARDDGVTVLEDAPATLLAVLANDSDAEGDPITIATLSSAAHGTVARVDSSPDKLSYTPFADYCNEPGPALPDTFTYTLDGGAVATVTVTVTCVDDNPNANDDAATVSEDAAGALIDVLANDSDGEGDAIEIVAALGSPQGSVVVVQGAPDRLAYTPAPNYCNSPGGAADILSYSVNGGDTATVAVTVTCVQDAPIANDDVRTVPEDSRATAINVLANDTDADGDPIQITGATRPQHGTIAVLQGSPDQLAYTPVANYCNSPGGAPDRVSYGVEGGDTATLAITVTCLPEPPMCAGSLATIVARPGQRTIKGSARDDVILGSNAGETIDGRGGNDKICGGKGNDTIRGGSGRDELRGDDGRDRLFGDGGNDLLLGGKGNDDLRGGAGADRSGGGDGNDRVDGGAGNDLLNEVGLGGAGNDRLFGGSGNDRVLSNGATRDRIDCGAGRDSVRMDSRDTQKRCERITRVRR
jgi:Ca2+-binding RTX toxin-like protein